MIDVKYMTTALISLNLVMNSVGLMLVSLHTYTCHYVCSEPLYKASSHKLKTCLYTDTIL